MLFERSPRPLKAGSSAARRLSRLASTVGCKAARHLDPYLLALRLFYDRGSALLERLLLVLRVQEATAPRGRNATLSIHLVHSHACSSAVLFLCVGSGVDSSCLPSDRYLSHFASLGAQTWGLLPRCCSLPIPHLAQPWDSHSSGPVFFSSLQQKSLPLLIAFFGGARVPVINESSRASLIFLPWVPRANVGQLFEFSSHSLAPSTAHHGADSASRPRSRCISRVCHRRGHLQPYPGLHQVSTFSPLSCGRD